MLGIQVSHILLVTQQNYDKFTVNHDKLYVHHNQIIHEEL